ncbi:MAG: hypothetical protein Q7R34_07140, partial [Dehalococcoidia bacterium]|nr:hypothetical protein [Dehalococcoidia bacterium]
DSQTHNLLSKYADEKAAIASGDQSVGPDWMGLSNRARNLAELKTKIEQNGINPWGIEFLAMFHMSNDSERLFNNRFEI